MTRSGDGDGDGDRNDGGRPWLLAAPVLFLLFFLPGAVWALASPLFSVPDEPAHGIKAAAVWQGQLSGTEVIQPGGVPGTSFRVPAVWAKAPHVPGCYAFYYKVTAECEVPFTGDTELADVATSAGHYPPLYYALVGWGARLSPGSLGMYLMRLTSAALCALLLAAAVRSLSTVLRPGWALLGVLAAATPMVSFLAGSVNPNGFEICAAIALWCSALAILRWPERHDAPVPRSLGATAMVAGTALAFTRSLSPMFVVAILAIAALCARWASIRRLLGEPFMRVVAAWLAVATVAAAALVVLSGHLDATPGSGYDPEVGPLRMVLGHTNEWIQQMIAIFGWMDTRVAQVSYYAWMFVIFGLVTLSFALVRLRRTVGLVAVLAATVALPIAAQLPRIATQGLVWQGRYGLPIAAGIPLIAVWLVDPASERIAGLRRRVTVLAAAVLGVGNLFAAYWALRRYVTGGDASGWIFSGAWQPPLGAAFLLAVLTLAAAAYVAVVAWSPATRRGEPRSEPAPAQSTPGRAPSPAPDPAPEPAPVPVTGDEGSPTRWRATTTTGSGPHE